MEQLILDPIEEKSMNLFDYISWIDSKIENKPFDEVVKGKAM